MKRIYEVFVSGSVAFGRDRWLFEAATLGDAVRKAESKLKRRRMYDGWFITSANEIGELSK